MSRTQSFLAVFDGHGGEEVADYACTNLWTNIKSSKGFDSSAKMIQSFLKLLLPDSSVHMIT